MGARTRPNTSPTGTSSFRREPSRSAPETPDEYQRFEDLTRKVARVPKSEVDEKRKKT